METDMDIMSFTEAMRRIDGANKKHLLLGNGFSISLKPDIFSYGSLYENADFSSAPHVPARFGGPQPGGVRLRWRLSAAGLATQVRRT
jgi:hypothetical protein